MVFFFYNIAQFTLITLALPFLCLILPWRPKSRQRLLARLGWRLQQQIATRQEKQTPRIWLHALSIGEVTSLLPLLAALRLAKPDALLILSVATQSGLAIAQQKATPYTTQIIAAPFDFLPVIHHFIRTIQPDSFIIVETDFWPNWLRTLRQYGVPSLLVNGRISEKSRYRYQQFSCLSKPMFKNFSCLAMQTTQDKEQIISLGLAREKVVTLGNLKYDYQPNPLPLTNFPTLIPNHLTLVCGSTHDGEEQIIFQAIRNLPSLPQPLQIILVPRDIQRSQTLCQLAREYGFTPQLRSNQPQNTGSLLIVDTIGELTGCYQLADLAFIGGSLVAQGGHNPLEAAACGIPILFGKHMEDFSEISAALITAGAAITTESKKQLQQTLEQILTSKKQRHAMGNAARQLITQRAGVTTAHLKLIEQHLNRT